MNPLYNIWNYNYIQQQAQQQYHQNQVQQVLEAAHKLQDYLDSLAKVEKLDADKVDPAYQGALTATCCAVLADYAKKHGII